MKSPITRNEVNRALAAENHQSPITNTTGVGFVGSIAYYYRPILEEAMQAEGLPLGTVLQDPIEGLKHYHQDSITPTM